MIGERGFSFEAKGGGIAAQTVVLSVKIKHLQGQEEELKRVLVGKMTSVVAATMGLGGIEAAGSEFSSLLVEKGSQEAVGRDPGMEL